LSYVTVNSPKHPHLAPRLVCRHGDVCVTSQCHRQ